MSSRANYTLAEEDYEADVSEDSLEKAAQELATPDRLIEYMQNETFFDELMLNLYRESDYLRTEFAKAFAEQINLRAQELDADKRQQSLDDERDAMGDW